MPQRRNKGGARMWVRAAEDPPSPALCGSAPLPTPAPLIRSSQFRRQVSESNPLLRPVAPVCTRLVLPGLGEIKGARRENTGEEGASRGTGLPRAWTRRACGPCLRSLQRPWRRKPLTLYSSDIPDIYFLYRSLFHLYYWNHDHAHTHKMHRF